MIIRLNGNIERLLPMSVELEVNGVSYLIEVPLSTSTELQDKAATKLEIAQVIREDSNMLYGFITKEERDIFLRLLKVNGVGAKTALAVLSSFSISQFFTMIQTNNLAALKSVKGIGAKVAGKIMLELSGYTADTDIESNNNSKLAYDALLALGFKDAEINTALRKLDSNMINKEANEIVKFVLKSMEK